MKLFHDYLAGQRQTCIVYDSVEEEEYWENKIREFYGPPVLSPFIPLSDVNPRRYFVANDNENSD
jgi:hypothetical protein